MGTSPYEWLHRLGVGASGEVWAARRDGEEIAVKLLRPSSEPRHEEALRRELTLGPLIASHPGVVGVRRVMTEGDVLLLEMDFVRGPNLAQALQAWLRAHEAPLPSSVAVPWAIQILHALAWVAERVAPERPHSFVHRDLKPANLLLERTGRVRVSDFGIARAEAELGFQATATGVVKGSPRFMAPELVRGASVDARTDQFSVGAVLLELLTGAPLYTGTDVQDVLLKAVRCDTADALAAAPCEPELRAVIAKMLSLNPADRYHTPLAAAAALEAAPVSGLPTHAVLEELLDLTDSDLQDVATWPAALSRPAPPPPPSAPDLLDRATSPDDPDPPTTPVPASRAWMWAVGVIVGVGVAAVASTVACFALVAAGVLRF